MPLCVDENLHYRLLKLAYGQHTQPYNFHAVLRQCPLLYGIWHPYKYAIALLHRTHFSLFLYLTNGTLTAGRQVPTTTRTRSMELLLAALLRLPLSERQAVRDRVVQLRWRLAIAGSPRRDPLSGRCVRGDQVAPLDAVLRPLRTRLAILSALDRLLSEWAPALVAIGWLVRECNWAGEASGTGHRAKEVLMACFHLLLRLIPPSEAHTVEYGRTLLCALVMWKDWHSALPACCYTDEMNEASLATFGSRWASHPEVQDADGAMDLFLRIPPPSQDPQDLPPKNCSGRLAHLV